MVGDNEMNWLEQLDERAKKRVSGPSWQQIWQQFEAVNKALLGVSRSAYGELTTIYIKYSAEKGPHAEPFAVLWVKRSTELILGLNMPEAMLSEQLTEPPKGFRYGQLNGYLRIPAGGVVPPELEKWAIAAFEHVSGASK